MNSGTVVAGTAGLSSITRGPRTSPATGVMSTQARAFLAVAIEGSFTGAAKRLNVSQPSITTQVGLIERQYKVELFHRIGRGVRLTPAGTALLPMVRRLFTSLDEATAYLQDLRGQRQGD